MGARSLVVAAVSILAWPAAGAPPDFAELASRLLPSVVNISVSQASGEDGGEQEFERFFRNRLRPGSPPRFPESAGSGFIVDPRGFIVTNDHVIAEAGEITVTLHDDTKLPAKAVGRDARTDLAVLKVAFEKPLAAAVFGDSAKLRVGEWVLAIGNPFGLGGTVTAGIVSARHRDINSGPYDDFIQTDASINRGNSGGPMFDLEGRVVGINNVIFSPTGGSVGIGFAIPSNRARPVIDQLIEFGRARRGWLGVQIQTVTDELAGSLGLDEASGALVSGLPEDGPAAKAGVEVGDIILRFDGKPVGEMRLLPRMVSETRIGKRVEIEVWRRGERVLIAVVLGEFPEDARAAVPAPEPAVAVVGLGMTLSAITPDLRERFGIEEDARGVVVTEVDEDGSAAESGIRPGTVIRKVGSNLRAVESPSEVESEIRRAGDAGSVLMLIEIEGAQRFVALAKG